MKKLLYILFLFVSIGYGQVFPKGFIMEDGARVTDTEMNAIVSPRQGMTVFNTDTDSFHLYLGAGWINTGGGLSSVSFTDITGNPEDNTALGVALGSYLPLSGGTMTGNISMGYNNISNLADLSVSNHITTPTITKEDTRFIPKDALPSNSEGWVYWDDSENRLKAYDGTSWKAFLLDGDASGSGSYLPLDGSSAMTGNMDLDFNQVKNVSSLFLTGDETYNKLMNFSWVNNNTFRIIPSNYDHSTDTPGANFNHLEFDANSDVWKYKGTELNSGGGIASTNFGLRKTVAKTANFTLSTEDARISSGGDIYKKPRITVNDGNSYTATLGNIGAVDDYFFFAVDNSGSELIVEPSSVDISLNGTTVTGNIKLSNDGEGFLYKTAASKFKAKGEWQLESPTVVNLFPTGNAASPDGDESDSISGWSGVDATLESQETDVSNGSSVIVITATVGNGNDRGQITISGLDPSKSYTLSYISKATGLSGFVQILSGELDGGQYLQAIGSSYSSYSTTVEPAGTSINLLVHAALTSVDGEIGDIIKFDNAYFTEN